MNRYVAIANRGLADLLNLDSDWLPERAERILARSRQSRAYSRVAQEEAQARRHDLWLTRMSLRRVRAESLGAMTTAASASSPAAELASSPVAAAS